MIPRWSRPFPRERFLLGVLPRILLVLAKGEPPGTILRLRNSRSAPLLDVGVEARPAIGWDVAVDPARIERLDPDQERSVRFRFLPPPDPAVGEHDFDVTVTARSAAGLPETLRRRFTVKVEGSVGTMTIPLLGGLVIVVAGLAWLAVRLAGRGA